MSEQTAAPNVDGVEQVGPLEGTPKPMPPAAPVEQQEGDEQLGPEGMSALRRERAEAKDAKARAAAAEARLREIEDAQKTDAQKQTEELDRLRKAVADHEAQQQRATWAAEVAAETGVPADVLRGSTLEELQAHAAVIKPLITAETGPRVPNPGATPQRKSVSDEAAFAAELFGPK